jgi:sugar phosphate isomerase/epimerase
MGENDHRPQPSGRRDFIRTAGAGLAAGGALLSGAAGATAAALTEEEKLDRIASNTWPARHLFKRREGGRPPDEEVLAMKKKYGEITMMDFAQFTKDTWPGVTHMDLWSSLFGDFDDLSMFEERTWTRGERTRTFYEFDPSTASAKKWLDALANKSASVGVECVHVSNNAPRDISDLDEEKRMAGIQVARNWLDASATLGSKTMRVNTGGPRVAPCATTDEGYPKNDEIVKYLDLCIDSFKRMAEYGEKVGVAVTIENHWGLSADPMLIRVIIDEVNSPFCKASPDFCNWEHEYHMYHGLKALVPYCTTIVHAKYWDRWENPDVQRCVRIMEDGGFKGFYALEYEDGPWDGIEGANYLLKEVMAAL